METFSSLLALCVGNSPVTGGFPSRRPVTRSFDVFFDLRLNKRLSKQSRRRRYETLSCSLWRHCNASILSVFRPSTLPYFSLPFLICFLFTLSLPPIRLAIHEFTHPSYISFIFPLRILSPCNPYIYAWIHSSPIQLSHSYFISFHLYIHLLFPFFLDSLHSSIHPSIHSLTHCGLVMPHGDRDLSQHRPR